MKLLELPPLELETEDKEKIIKFMEGSIKNESLFADIPLGDVYLGQLLAHEVVKSKLDDLSGFTQAIDGDSFFLRGIEMDKFLYDKDGRFLIDVRGKRDSDFYRMPNTNLAITGDHRNDENVFIAQICLALMHYHNKLIDNGYTFDESRRMFCHTIQRIFRNILLRVSSHRPTERFSNYLKSCDKVAQFDEFNFAALRYGHSQVPSRMNMNDNNLAVDLFDKTRVHMDFDYFWETGDNTKAQRALAIGCNVSSAMKKMTGQSNPSIIRLNIESGLRVGLPSMHDVSAMIIQTDFPYKSTLDIADKIGIDHKKVPLWTGILAEAKKSGKLGLVGSSLVIGGYERILMNDKKSFMNQDRFNMNNGPENMEDLIREIRS